MKDPLEKIYAEFYNESYKEKIRTVHNGFWDDSPNDVYGDMYVHAAILRKKYRSLLIERDGGEWNKGWNEAMKVAIELISDVTKE